MYLRRLKPHQLDAVLFECVTVIVRLKCQDCSTLQHRKQRPCHREEKQGGVNVYMDTIWVIAHQVKLALNDGLWCCIEKGLTQGL